MKIAIVYHSGYGHTQVVAKRIAAAIEAQGAGLLLYDVTSSNLQPEALDDADTIIFGSPTYFGNVSAEFKSFMDSTTGIWSAQRWKDKLAAGFTNSSTRSGDKYNTLTSLFTFAAQHSMLWIPLGILPVFDEQGHQEEEHNGLGSYVGLMTMSPNSHSEFLPPADLVTAELFGIRITHITKKLKQYSNNETIA